MIAERIEIKRAVSARAVRWPTRDWRAFPRLGFVLTEEDAKRRGRGRHAIRSIPCPLRYSVARNAAQAILLHIRHPTGAPRERALSPSPAPPPPPPAPPPPPPLRRAGPSALPAEPKPSEEPTRSFSGPNDWTFNLDNPRNCFIIETAEALDAI